MASEASTSTSSARPGWKEIPQEWRGAICVFCGSSPGLDPQYTAAAKDVGTALAENDIPLVYGGGTSGLMGTVATATILHPKGQVHGVIPKAMLPFERDTSSTSLPTPPISISKGSPDDPNPVPTPQAKRNTSIDVSIPDLLCRPVPSSSARVGAGKASCDRSVVTHVGSMHERKKLMADWSELGFIALPGGYGTLDEVAEMGCYRAMQTHFALTAVVLINVMGFFTPLRDFVDNAIKAGFIRSENRDFMLFIDKPAEAGSDWDWGEAAVKAVKAWHQQAHSGTLGKNGKPFDMVWDV